MHSQESGEIRRSILLVEDDAVFLRVLSRALEQRSFEVLSASKLSEAKSLVTTHGQQIDGGHLGHAILDLNLGGHSSLSLIPLLKQMNPQIHILMLTGYASIATAVEAIKLGASNYLAKPADMDEIMTALLSDPDRTDGADSWQGEEQGGATPAERMSVRRLEWEHIQKVLQDNNGNVSATARQLNMHRRTLQRKLQKRPVAK
ncbi:MAG: DNA-binding response regulator [Pseudohongiella sp.]|nr:MAG: DNA-binding response regulator [Pseudohongiella sp.]